ncbi:MAG: hypothetical protein JNG84_09135, partial [Archangium sp.]|nr:hypothetical protein [Archangium sp.]
AAKREREAQVERAVAQAIRTLGLLLQRAADSLDKKRLERQGYAPPGQFLERTPRR